MGPGGRITHSVTHTDNICPTTLPSVSSLSSYGSSDGVNKMLQSHTDYIGSPSSLSFYA